MTELEKLKKLIPEFGVTKHHLDTYKSMAEDVSKQIKEIMGDFALQQFVSSGYKVTRVVQERESMNEELLLSILKEQGCAEGIIKTREYVDMDALEKAIYNGELSEDNLLALDKAKESKTVIQLRIKKTKEADTDVY